MRPKEERNRELIELRLEDPKEWTFAKLGERYEISEEAAVKIFHRDKHLYTS